MTPGTMAPRHAVDRRELVAALEDDGAWPDAAADLLADLGFRLIEVDRLGTDDTHLLIALRDRPTLDHFDPESVGYYAPASGVGAMTTIDRHTSRDGGRTTRQVLWGHVHVIDRIPVENRFLTFGGRLRTAAVDPTTTVMDLWSPAPIVRWGGHSQGTDGLAEAIGAFFGRLIVPVDFTPGAEARIDAVPPDVLYRAFLELQVGRRAALRNCEPSDLDDFLAGAWMRAQADPIACRAGHELLADLGMPAPSR